MHKRFRGDGKPSIRLNETQIKEIDIVKQKISSKQYTYVDSDCLVCGEKKNLELISEKDRYGFDFTTKVCKSCGLVFASNRFSRENYDDFYISGHQKRIYVGSERPKDIYFKNQYLKGKRIYNFLHKLLPNKKPLRVLEVGCGAGAILKVFAEYGHQIKGVDLNPEYIEFGKTVHGLNLSTQNFFNITDEEYDLIIYSHVLEHLMNPGEHLDHIKKLLPKDGLLYIEVPGIKNCYKQYGDLSHYIQNAHVTNFSYTTLHNLMSKYHYSPLSRKNEYVRSLWRVSENNDVNIVNDYNSIVKYLSWNNLLFVRMIHIIRRKIKGTIKLIKGILPN